MDPSSRYIAGLAQNDFERARRKAFWSGVGALLQRRPNALLSFEEVQRLLAPQAQVYRGLQQVQVKDIIGSVDRYQDFNRNFLPVQTHTRGRWEAIDRATRADEVLPPVQLYEIGEVYFVKDGNHRVSVARERGQEIIDAEVIECPTSVPITSRSDARDLLGLAEYARFLEQTRLDKERPGAVIEFTGLGRYDVLLEHISAQRWYMGVEQKQEISWRDAVLSWYDNVYRPLVQVIEESGILADFPGHTAADLYLWVMDHRYYLEQETGHPVGPSTALFSYDAHYGRWSRRVLRSLQHLTGKATKPLIVSAGRIRRALAALRPGPD